MICVRCRKQIKVESETFKEVGSIEFAHSRCVEEQAERLKDKSVVRTNEERRQETRGGAQAGQ